MTQNDRAIRARRTPGFAQGSVARFLAWRAAQALLVVAVVTTLVFALIHAAPGDPFASAIENPNVTPALRAQWRHEYGLDQPLSVQYVRYVGQMLHGNLGWSFSMRRPVRDVLWDALPNTMVLTSVALILGFGFGILVGVFQATRAGSRIDRGITRTILTLAGLPDFWVALLAMLTFAYWFPILPVAGAVDPVMHDYLGWWGRLTDRMVHLILPAGTLAILIAATVARHQRTDLLRILPEEYIRAARARGISERRILWRHALRNALIPVATLLGLSIPLVFTGAVFVERIFAWPGMGWTILNAVFARDYPLATAGVIVASTTVAFGSFIADVLYAWADPRAYRA